MAKEKNSLGIVVLTELPIGDPAITFDQYKELYGVDLNEIFVYSTNTTIFKQSFTKLIVLKRVESPYGVTQPLAFQYNGDSIILASHIGEDEGFVVMSGLVIDAKLQTVQAYEY